MRYSPFLKIQQREPSGRIQRTRERVEDVIANALNNRRRLGVHEDHARLPMAGSVLGRLRLRGDITDEQYNCGVRFAGVVTRYARVMGIPMPNPKSASAEMVGGQDCGSPDLDDAAVFEIRRDYENVYCVIYDAAHGRDYMAAMKSVVLQDQPAELGDLRCGLNLLGHLWR